MRSLHRSSKFKNKKVSLSDEFVTLLKDTIGKLQSGVSLDEKLQDHALSGNLSGFRELHIKPDLLLVYRVTADQIQLVRLNSHSNIF